MTNDALKFARRLLAPDVLLLGAELAVVFVPLIVFFDLDERQRTLLPQVLAVVWLFSLAVWLVVTRIWRTPLSRACRRRLTGQTLDADTRTAAYAALRAYPRRALGLRVALWSIGATATALTLNLRAGFPHAA